jgi:hypothetical protein
VEEISGLQQRGGCCGDEGMGVCEFVVFNSSDVGGSEGQQQTLVPGVSGTKHNSCVPGHRVLLQGVHQPYVSGVGSPGSGRDGGGRARRIHRQGLLDETLRFPNQLIDVRLRILVVCSCTSHGEISLASDCYRKSLPFPLLESST